MDDIFRRNLLNRRLEHVVPLLEQNVRNIRIWLPRDFALARGYLRILLDMYHATCRVSSAPTSLHLCLKTISRVSPSRSGTEEHCSSGGGIYRICKTQIPQRARELRVETRRKNLCTEMCPCSLVVIQDQIRLPRRQPAARNDRIRRSLLAHFPNANTT